MRSAWLIAMLLLAAASLLGCRTAPVPPREAITQALAVPDLNRELLGTLALNPDPLDIPRIAGRAMGSLERRDHTLLWVDPELGLTLIDIQEPTTPTVLARLQPRQQPAEAVLFDQAIVVRSQQGPFALELFVQGPDSQWTWTQAVQRGHYDALFAATGNLCLAWNKEANQLDCWAIDLTKGTLAPRWQWSLPEHTDAIAVTGDYLAIAVHNTAFQVGARSQTGSGVLLYGLDADPAQPTLYDRWKAPVDGPLTHLLWYGRGLVASQGTTLYLVQRSQGSRWQLLGTTQAETPLAPIAASGRFIWLRGPDSVRLWDIGQPRAPILLAGAVHPLTPTTPFAIFGTTLWSLAPALEPDPIATTELAELVMGYHPATAAEPAAVLLRAWELTRSPPSTIRATPGTGPTPLPVASDVARHGDFLYVPEGGNGVSVWQLAGTNAPLNTATFLTRIDIPGEVQQILIRDRWAYLTNHSAGFQLLDLRDPASPRLVPNREHFREGTGLLAAQGRRLLAASDILTIARITQPGVVYVDLRYELPQPAEGLAIEGNRTYVSCGEAGIQILDTGENHPLVVLNVFRTGHRWGRLAVRDKRLYAVRNRTELAVFDMARTINPELLQVIELNAPITSLATSDTALWIGLATAAGGEVREYARTAGTDPVVWRASHWLPGPPLALRPDGPRDLFAVYGRGSAQGGVMNLGDQPAQIRVLGPLPLPAATGPWLAAGARFWTTTESQLAIRDASAPGLPVLAASDISLDATIWQDRNPKSLSSARLLATGHGALAVIRKGWVHLRPTPYGTIATDPWPLTATEQVLAARDGRVLLWDHDSLTYQPFALQADSAPLPLTAQNWSGSHPEGGGAWEVVDGAIQPLGDGVFAPATSPVTWATAEAFSGGTLYRAGQRIAHQPGIVTTVALSPGGAFAAAGVLTGTDDLQPRVRVIDATGVTWESALPGIPQALLMPNDTTVIAHWRDGLTVCQRDRDPATFAGRMESVQLGAGWDTGRGGELIVRFTGRPEWSVLQVTG